MTALRYSRPRFRTGVLVAAVMTGAVCGGVWMLLTAFAVRHSTFYAGLTAGIFFAFVSATMLLRYMRGEVVLAVRPNGLFDTRWRAETVPWEMIREVVVRRKEDEIELDVYLWQTPSPERSRGDAHPSHTIDLASLDGSARSVIDAISGHARVRTEKGAEIAEIVPLSRAGG